MIKKQVCQICGNSFSKKQHINRHIAAVHDRKKPHKCGVCPSTFTEVAKLRKHIANVHEGKKPHKCEVCPSSFSEGGTLRQHIKSIHEETWQDMVERFIKEGRRINVKFAIHIFQPRRILLTILLEFMKKRNQRKV